MFCSSKLFMRHNFSVWAQSRMDWAHTTLQHETNAKTFWQCESGISLPILRRCSLPCAQMICTLKGMPACGRICVRAWKKKYLAAPLVTKCFYHSGWQKRTRRLTRHQHSPALIHTVLKEKKEKKAFNATIFFLLPIFSKQVCNLFVGRKMLGLPCRCERKAWPGPGSAWS